ncbi:MAG: hypothetical protein IT449_00765 [Phycisphaerales bacterium]|nr:hypothetical protein [Phycisphaerales bacterium]
MSKPDACDPIADDEIVLKHVTERSGWYDPSREVPVKWEAFRPNANDVNGKSVWRAKYKTADEVARLATRFSNRKDHRYFVMSLRVGDLRRIGIQVAATPDEGQGELGHASLSNLNVAEYESHQDTFRALAERICRELILCVSGPFGPFGEDARETP